MEESKRIRLELFAQQLRLESILSMASCGSGHVGGVLSAAELIAVLYGDQMRYDPNQPNWEDRDRLVLSKGHCGPILYAALALKGFFPMELLSTLNHPGSSLPSHCNSQDTPGIDVSTGSLGQGASLAAGIALGLRMQHNDAYTYLILGDGECDEGQVWEMALFAAQQKLDHLIAFVDFNHQQLDGDTKDILDLGDLRQKFSNFGWNAIQVNGHDVSAIQSAIVLAKATKGRPTAVILDTIKGKGWSKTEGKHKIHHIPLSPEDADQARQEIGARIAALEKKAQEVGADGV